MSLDHRERAIALDTGRQIVVLYRSRERAIALSCSRHLERSALVCSSLTAAHRHCPRRARPRVGGRDRHRHRRPRTDHRHRIPFVAAALLTAYPLIDVVASLASARVQEHGTALRVNAAISALAAVVVGATAFGSDAGAALAAFGAWAAVSGAMQFVLALRGSRQVPMLISGGVSTLAGVSFLSAAGMHDAHLAVLGGYMAVGAVLYLVSARRRPRAWRSG